MGELKAKRKLEMYLPRLARQKNSAAAVGECGAKGCEQLVNLCSFLWKPRENWSLFR